MNNKVFFSILILENCVLFVYILSHQYRAVSLLKNVEKIPNLQLLFLISSKIEIKTFFIVFEKCVLGVQKKNPKIQFQRNSSRPKSKEP